MSDMLPSITPSWVKMLGYALVVTAVVGPYTALYRYVPKYNTARIELSELHKKFDDLTQKNEALEDLRSACSDATERMKQGRDRADQRRRVAERSALSKASAHDTKIAELKLRLKEPTDDKQECKQLKDLVDEYTLGPANRVRNDNASGAQGSGSPSANIVR